METHTITLKDKLMNLRSKVKIEMVPSNMVLIWRTLEPHEHRRILVLSMASIAVNALDLLSAYAISLLGIVALQYRNSSEITIQNHNIIAGITQNFDLSSKELLIWLATLSFFTIVMKIFLSLAVNRSILLNLGRISSDLSRRLFDKFLEARYNWVKSQQPQDITYAINQGSQFLVIGILGQGMIFVSDLVVLIVFLLTLLWLNFLSTIVVTVALVLVIYLYSRKIKVAINTSSNELLSSTISGQEATLDIIKMWREIRIQNRNKFAVGKFSKYRESASRSFAIGSWLQLFPKAAFEIFGLLIIIIVLLPVIGVSHWKISETTLVFTFAVVSRILPIGTRIQQTFFAIQSYGPPAITLLKLYENLESQASDISDEIIGYLETTNGYQIDFTDLFFQYPDASKALLKLPAFSIPEGSFVGVVGPSGSGKSTFCDLLLGFLVPTTGKIEIGGCNIADIRNYESLGISFVSQNTKIVQGSIAENIRFGLSSKSVTDSAIIELVTQLGLGDVIGNLPKGLETALNAESSVISGGEQQRIGIARALISNPRILLMDEATNALDNSTAKKVLNFLISKKQKRTVFLITHDPSYLIKADTILSFHNGNGRIFNNYEKYLASL